VELGSLPQPQGAAGPLGAKPGKHGVRGHSCSVTRCSCYYLHMPAPPREDAAAALAILTHGDSIAAAQLMEQVYAELRGLAGQYFRGQRQDHTLQPTALVHEAFARVAAATGAHLESRAHFTALCAIAMRNILADHARRRRAVKRGGGRKRVTLADVGAPVEAEIDALDLDQALTELQERSERQARIVEYRYFSGMSVPEIVEVLGVSRSTVENDWRMARAWLTVRLRSHRTT